MADIKDPNHHLITIPATEDHRNQKISAIEHHPSTEISDSPGHLLLLKLLQREQNLSGQRIARKETRLDTLKREIFQLCLFFFAFHGLFLTMLFTSSRNVDAGVCRKWWIPIVSSVSFCLVMVVLVQMKLFGYWKVCEQIQRSRTENRGLARCVQELRLKGVGFDLSKEVGNGNGNGKRMKSSSVEVKWKMGSWCSKYFVTICLVSASGLVIPVGKFVICM